MTPLALAARQDGDGAITLDELNQFFDEFGSFFGFNAGAAAPASALRLPPSLSNGAGRESRPQNTSLTKA